MTTTIYCVRKGKNFVAVEVHGNVLIAATAPRVVRRKGKYAVSVTGTSAKHVARIVGTDLAVFKTIWGMKKFYDYSDKIVVVRRPEYDVKGAA